MYQRIKLAIMVTAHLFWAYGSLSRLEILSINSFIYHGFKVILWSYDKIPNTPHGCELRDAREILSEDLVFLNQKGSYAGFSDLFRYAVLNQKGGLYADTDVVCLKNANELPHHPFLVTEESGTRKKIINQLRKLVGFAKPNRINGNVIFNPNPKKGNLIDLAFQYSLNFPKTEVKWSEIGPSLLSAIIKIYPTHGFKIMSPEFANPISQHDCPKLLLSNKKLPKEAYFLHCYNEKWRRSNVDKNMPYPIGSILDKLDAIFNINQMDK